MDKSDASAGASRGDRRQPSGGSVPKAGALVKASDTEGRDTARLGSLAIEVAGATMRQLPSCSPDFNPIETAFSKLKADLRKAAARTVDELWNVIRDALKTFTPKDCANYLAAAGCEPD